MPSNHYGEMEAVIGDHQIFDPDRVRHHVIGVARELDNMTDRIEALEAAREQEGKDMAGEQGERPEIRAQEQCAVCGESFYGDTALEAQDAVDHHLQNSHGTERISAADTLRGRPSRKVIRWTITGEGGALESRAMTWSMVLDIVERAEKLGLRVEVAEVEEEVR